MNAQVSFVQYDLLKMTYTKSEVVEEKKSAITAQKSSTKVMGEDRVTLNTPTDKKIVTYGRPITDQERINSKFLMLGELVAYVFKEQGLTNSIDSDNEKAADMSSMTPKEAKESIGEDGYWGLGRTSERIFNLALGFAGFDTGKLDKVREGVLKGFDMAKKAFGGELPEISQKTINMAMIKLDEWEKDPVKSLPL